MVIQKRYSQSQETAIASYDYTDIAAGTGNILFYGAATTITGSSTDYKLTESPFICDPVKTKEGVTQANTAKKEIDVDFDLTEFNLPRTIKGEAILSMALSLEETAHNVKGYVIAKIRKWDGTTETDIVTAQSAEETSSGGTWEDFQVTIPLTIPETHFKKGETLRLTIEGWAYGVGGAPAGNIEIWHDATDTDGDGEASGVSSTALKLFCPFEIDL